MNSTESRHRPGQSRGLLGRFARGVVLVLWPTQRLLWTREGLIYLAIWMVLLVLGLQQQINLILLVAGLAAGPVVASFVVSASMLKKLRVGRRVPPYAFSGDPLHVDYTLENFRRWTAALALFIEDEMAPVDRSVSGSSGVAARVFFNRVPGREKSRVRWVGVSPKRGRYRFRAMELVTRSPFGLLERRVTLNEPDDLVVYPAVGRLTRRWHLLQRQATETRRGRRHDRSSQQQEYHGLRDYRPGDSQRWIHWRTTARIGVPMVKEFEQRSEQDLALLLDPWLPRTKVTAEQREALEQAVQFAATVCLETCRRSGRRLLLGWTGPTPGLRQGPASVKLLHELLEQLAVVRGTGEGALSALLDILPPSTVREASLVVVSTRPVNLVEEAERSSRLSGVPSRGILGRVTLLDASRGELDGYVEYGGPWSSTAPVRRGGSQVGPGRSVPGSDSPADGPGPVAAVASFGRNGREGRP
ncbi:MAG: DUF58 domain-containing protein [Planctomycetia bacterium]|nr:DUF58 domain-containing protein [Planctomycetia bacterium]